MKTIDLHSIFI